MENYNHMLPCMNGFTLYIKASNLIISSKRSEEIVPIDKLQSFVMKEPKALSPGSIVFRTAQAATASISLGLGIGAAIGAERTFFFTKANVEDAQKVKEYICTYENNKSTNDEKSVISVVDEIRGLKGLLDDGIITQAEFDAKKKQLLGV